MENTTYINQSYIIFRGPSTKVKWSFISGKFRNRKLYGSKKIDFEKSKSFILQLKEFLVAKHFRVTAIEDGFYKAVLKYEIKQHCHAMIQIPVIL